MTTPAATPDPDRIRASDADRERVAAVVHQAMGDGRLTLAEVDERLKQVYAAKTFAELRPVIHDLPGHEVALPSATSPATVHATAANAAGRPIVIGGAESETITAILSGATRQGSWIVPRRLRTVAIMGGVDLDLTGAAFAGAEVTIEVTAVMGGISLVIPPDITVISNVVAIMGGTDNKVLTDAPPGSPVVRVTGFAMFGGVEIKPPKRRRLDRSG